MGVPIRPTSEQMNTIIEMRNAREGWEAIALAIGRSRYWVQKYVERTEVAKRLKYIPKPKVDPVHPARREVGMDPLPSHHPYAMQFLDQAMRMQFP